VKIGHVLDSFWSVAIDLIGTELLLQVEYIVVLFKIIMCWIVGETKIPPTILNLK
jgi:hypothetical protein